MNMTSFDASDHLSYLSLALAEARKSPPKPTNFCVGALVLAPTTSSKLLITGYTLECEGNTHAEQSCLIKLGKQYGCSEQELGEHLPNDTILYTTIEPCNKRSAVNTPCVDGILALKKTDSTQAIRQVVCGVTEPETFVGVNGGKKKLQDAGIKVIHIPELEKEILKVATAGHKKKDDQS